ncbi:hypothetical protein BJ912DRAFT_958986 [Pholiota molesta]|nr:hypothetical protein BJ912DRAFT_958986 [Pholiota molesta]
MYIPLKLLCLLSWPRIVLGSFQVLVQTPSSTFKPGDTITYTLVADPIPSGTLGMMLIQVQEGNAGDARPYFPFSVAMTFSPKQFSIQIPTTLTLHSFYTIDAHANSSVDSTLLGNSEPFEIIITSPSSTPTGTTSSATQTTVAQPTSLSLSVGTQSTAFTTSSQIPSSDLIPPSSPTASVNSVNLSEGPATTTSNSAAGSIAPSSSGSADGSAISPAPKSRSTPVGAIVGGVIGGILIIILLLTALLWRRRRQRHQRDAALSTPPDTTNSYTAVTQQDPSALLDRLYAQRPFVPNRTESLPSISPFVLSTRESLDGSPSPDLSSAKSKEALGNLGGGPGHVPSLPSVSLSGEKIAGRVVSQDVLRSERERVLSEISALRTGTTTGATFSNTITASAASATQSSFFGSSALAVGSEEDTDGASEMRDRLEQLTDHVRRLESALEQVSHSYDAPPEYDELRRASQM